jgi:hypothetical protein
VTDREIMEALLAGKRLRNKQWLEGAFVRLDESGMLVGEDDAPVELGVFDEMLLEDAEVLT